MAEFADLGRILVIIPTYNELGNIERIVGRLRAAVPEAHALIADDNSPDGTGEVADRLAATDDQVHVMHRRGKEGLGAAYLAGFTWGLDNGYDVLVEMDADGSHQPEELHRLLEGLRNADVALGSRWVPGGSVVNWPGSRKLISKGGSFYARKALKLPIKDVTGGYKAFRASALRSLDFNEVESAGFVFQIDLTNRLHKKGLTIVEVPIEFVEREIGDSKMDSSIMSEAFKQVTKWGYRDRFKQPK